MQLVQGARAHAPYIRWNVWLGVVSDRDHHRVKVQPLLWPLLDIPTTHLFGDAGSICSQRLILTLQVPSGQYMLSCKRYSAHARL